MKTLFTQHLRYQFNWYRIVLFSIFVVLTGIYSINIKGQNVALTVNTAPINASISTAGEEDWYSFVIGAPGTYTIQTYGSLDNYMYLYQMVANIPRLLAEDDNSGIGDNPKITRTNLYTSQTYRIKIKASSPTATGNYQINVIDESVYPPPRNLTGTLGTPGTGQYTLSWTAPISGTPTLYKIYTSTTENGIYYQTGSASVTGVTVFNPIGPTYWHFITAMYGTIESSPSNIVSLKPDALPVTLTVSAAPTNAAISTMGEVDWYMFQTSTAGTYTIQTYGSFDTYMGLLSSNLTLIESDDDDGAGANALISRSLDANTWYYVRITAGGPDPYSIDVKGPTVAGGCLNETFTAASGTITDNSGSSNYLNYMTCDKLIQPNGGGPITLTFNSFATEANYDFVYVYDGSTTSATLLGTYSGTSLPPVLRSTGGSLLIRFSTDRGVVAAGWSATYTSGATIAVTSPNGGESWQVGTAQNITWSSAGNSGNVHLEYSTNNGSSWTNIITSTPDDATYAWTIPNTLSTTCLVRVSDFDGSPTDVSNTVFSIIPVASGTCINETFTVASGTITDNSGSLNYLNYQTCEKLIQPTGGGTITLTFTSFATEANYDFVSVYAGSTTSATLLGTFSGTSLPPVLTSTTGSMLIRFTTDRGVVATGWSATYTSTSAIVATGLIGIGISCTDGQINFSSISGGSGPEYSCHVYGVDVYGRPVDAMFSGETGTSGTLSGLPPTCNAGDNSKNGYNVIFFDNLGHSSQVYSVVIERPDICIGWCINETFMASSGTITDNSGTSDYHNNMTCGKLIQPTGGGPITLTFTSFNTEANYDYIYIFDGSTTSATLLGMYSGTTLPPVLTSSGGSLLIVFVTNGATVAQGWSATYTCGTCINENFTAASGTVTDGSGSSNYLNYQTCEKLIQPTGGGTITLTFSSFATEPGYDFVSVYAGSTTSATLLGTFSGTSLPPVLTSTNGSMLIRFTTDRGVVAAGWSASYTTGVPAPYLNVSPTSVTLGSTSGSLGTFTLSTNTTTWSVQSNVGWFTILSEVRVPGTDNITFTLSATSANTGTSPRSGTLTFRVTGVSDKTVTVTQDPMVPTSCINETFTAASGTVTDGSGSSNYLNYQTCEKLIQQTGGGTITLTFTSFATEANYDFVSVYAGSTTSATLLGTFSGTSLPPVLTSGTGSMLIRFTTDRGVVAAGWSANYTTGTVYTGCINETFTAASGIVTDGSGSLNYLNYMTCEKLIQPAGGGTITLAFTSFATEANFDFVYVYAGSTTSATLLGTYSGTALPPTLTSSAGSMLIRFTTDRGVVAAGWSATYTSSGGGKGAEEILTQEVPPVDKLVAYPNPTSGILTIESPFTEEITYTIDLINVSGQVILNQIINVIGGKFEIDMSDVSSGSYMLRIMTKKTVQFINVIKN